jgi:hypothetical protein
MNRTGERRNGSERRRRTEVLFPWQEPVWDTGWVGPERRIGDRRVGEERRQAVPRTDDLKWYSDDWARARGAPDFNTWLNQSAKQAPLGLPDGWSPAA